MTIYSYTKAKQSILYFVLALLPVVGLVCFYQALDMWEVAKWVWCGLWAGISALFLTLFFIGLRWRSFISMGIEITAEGLVMHQGNKPIVHPWETIGRADNWALLQLLIIYDSQGKIVLPVDYMLTNFADFKRDFDRRGQFDSDRG